MKISTED